jgi:2TM domain
MDDIVYRRAKARVEARLGFYRHAMIYVAVNLFLIFLNLRHERDHFWFQWPLLGWGIGLFWHGWNVYSYRWNSARKDRMIQGEMERDERARGTRADA